MAAKIDERAFRSYVDGQDRMTAQEYMRDREILRKAVNDLEDRILLLEIELQKYVNADNTTS